MRHRFFWGGTLLLGGLLLLASNFGLIPPFNLLDLWPILVMWLAVKILLGSRVAVFSKGSQPVAFPDKASLVLRLFALWLLIGASAELLHNVHLFPYGWDSFNQIAFPVLLIALGLMILNRSGGSARSRRQGSVVSEGAHAVNAVHSVSSLVGDLRFGSRPWVFESPMAITLWAGDIDMDLTTAEFPPGESRLWARVWLGEVDIRVPDNIELHVEAHAAGGQIHALSENREGLAIAVETARPAAAGASPAGRFENGEARRLHIGVEIMLGSIRIR